MLMPRPTPETRKSPEKADEGFTRYERRLIRKVERRGRLNLGLTAALGGIALIGGLYWNDVHANQEHAAEAKPDVDVIHESSDPLNDSAFIFFNGFGENDADRLAELQGPVVEQVLDGEWWSVGYGNAGLDEKQISDQIIDLAEERGISTISIYGYSAGGSIALQTIEHVLADSDLQLQSIWADSMPDGDDGVRPGQLQLRDSLMTASEYVPGAKYSTFWRYVGEMAFRQDQFITTTDSGIPSVDVDDFFRVSNYVSDAIADERLPGAWLLIDQVMAISATRTEERLAHIAEMTKDELHPVIVYLGTADPGYDYMVNDSLSAENICTYAGKVGLRCFTYSVPGAVHTRPDLANDEYMATVAAAAPEINSALEWAEILNAPVPSLIEEDDDTLLAEH